MLQVARLAPRLLGDSSALVRDFVLGELNDDGGFRDREGSSDLYYTVFGLDALHALQVEVPVERVAPFLDAITAAAVSDLDLVHVASLARCWTAVGRPPPDDVVAAIRDRLDALRCDDGGWANEPGSASGTVYGCFLALGAHQDLGRDLVDADRACALVESLRTPDGGYANERSMRSGATPATAAAVSFLRNTGRTPGAGVAEWLIGRLHEQGGFVATPATRVPDLLSTAVALHALDGLEFPIATIGERCLDFLDTLWTNRGSFYGHWGEQTLDCEYTFYGLLAIGHLSL